MFSFDAERSNKNKMAGLLQQASTALGAIPTPVTQGISLAGQIFGAVKSAKAAKENEKILNGEIASNEADYNNTANRSFLETNVAKDVVKAVKDNTQEQLKDTAGRSVITGASDEAKVAANSAIQKNSNDALSRLASMGTSYQERAKDRYLNRKGQLLSSKMAINTAKSESAANMADNAGGLLTSAMFNTGMKPNAVAAGGVPGRTDLMQGTLTQIAKSAKI